MPFPLNLIFNIKMFYFVFIIVMIASMAAVGLASGSSQSRNKLPPNIETTPQPEVTPVIHAYPSPAPVLDATAGYVATLVTNKGNITIELSPDAPEAVNSFAFLASKNFYDGSYFFYLDHNFWAQAGDPACNTAVTDVICTGTGDAGYRLSIENPSAKHEQWAVVAPVIQGTDTVSGGQFRILFQADERLNGKETVFGTVTEGRDILENAVNLHLCTALTQATSDCAENYDEAIVIQDVSVDKK